MRPGLRRGLLSFSPDSAVTRPGRPPGSLSLVWSPAQIIGVEPEGANAMALSLQRGERIALSRVDAFADGVAVKQVS